MTSATRNLFVISAMMVSMFGLAGAQNKLDKQIKKSQVKPSNPVSGAEMFKEYCAVCHGTEGKGDGPAASALKVPPPDLTTLAKRHDGKFPSDYVANVLKSGVSAAAHGDAEMPVWGPIFRTMNRNNDAQVTLRISNLTNYLKSIQKN